MHQLARLVMPKPYEIVLYLLAGFILITAITAPDLWQALLSASNTDPQTYGIISQSINDLVGKYTNVPNPQLINSAIWGLTAGLALFIVATVSHFIQATKEDAKVLHSIRDGEFNFWTRLVLRVGGTVLLCTGVILYLLVVLPASVSVYSQSLSELLLSWKNGFLALGCILATASCIYAFAIICRLITLKVRVFSETYEQD